MSITYHERPGVYVEYDTAGRSVAAAPRVAAIIAEGSGSGLYRFSSPQAALQTFSAATTIGKMVQLAFAGGASQVLCRPVNGTSFAYNAALTLFLAEREIGSLAVETDNTEILMGLAAQISAEGAKECVCFAGLDSPTDSALCTLAEELNCPRMVVMGANVRYAGDDDLGGGCLAAAAMAGVFSARTDPALPLSGAVLPGLDGIGANPSETEIDTLVRAGVTPLELIGGQVCVIRAVTTATTLDGVADETWHELSTVAIVDDVIPTIRDTLRAKFLRRKNTAVTRNAIASQVAIVLDDRVRREIIEGYEDLKVEAVSGDPTTCRVSFGFSVVQGIGRIHLSVHILV